MPERMAWSVSTSYHGHRAGPIWKAICRDDIGCATPLFTLTQPVYAQAMAMGLGDQDTAAVFEVLKKTIVTDPKPIPRDHR